MVPPPHSSPVSKPATESYRDLSRSLFLSRRRSYLQGTITDLLRPFARSLSLLPPQLRVPLRKFLCISQPMYFCASEQLYLWTSEPLGLPVHQRFYNLAPRAYHRHLGIDRYRILGITSYSTRSLLAPHTRFLLIVLVLISV